MNQAIFLIRHGNPETSFEMREIKSVEPKSEELTIETEYSGLNYADVMARRGLYAAAPAPPGVLGYDIVGRIIGVGANTDASRIGERVLAFTRFGGYASRVNVHQSQVLSIPENIDGADATALATQYATAYFAVFMRSQIMPGDGVLQHAASGGVGLAIFQMVKHLGGFSVGITGNEDKKAKLLQMGMSHVINRNAMDYSLYVKEHFPDGMPWIYNSVAGKTFKKDLKLLSTGGQLILYGAAERGKYRGALGTLRLLWNMGLLIPIKLMIQSQGITGINMLAIGDHKPELLRHCFEKVLELNQIGAIKPVSKSYAATDIASAHADLESGNSMGKLALRWK